MVCLGSNHITASSSFAMTAITFSLLLIGTVSADEADSANKDEHAGTGKPGARVVASGLPDLPESLTSFGGAVCGDSLYVYGGHTGSAHSYSVEEQSDRFYRLDLGEGKAWEELPAGPRLQGLALVGHRDNIYRLGGFTALNEEGEDQDLHSQASFARFDVETRQWTELTPLPEPRSSFDAAVSGNKLMVVGGWSMQGEAENVWHQTAWIFDLSDEAAQWKPVPKPPFQRRALSVAALDDKFYAIGGMQSDNEMTTRVDIYDPKTRQWKKGPNLRGDASAGFGSAAFATGGRLYVSTIRGDFQRLSRDGQSWEVLCKIEPSRFFHRMLPRDDDSLLLLGGANMSIGKFTEIEQLDVTNEKK